MAGEEKIHGASLWLLGSWIALVAFISFVPTYYLPPFLVFSLGGLDFASSKYLPWILVIVTGCLFFLTADSLWKALYELVRVPFLWSLGIYSAIGLLSLFKAEYLLVGGYKWLYFSMTGPLVYLLSSRLEAATGLRLIEAMVVVGAIVAGYGILEYLLGYSPLFAKSFQRFNPYYSGPGRVSSSIGNPIALGSYLTALLPMAWFLVNRSVWKSAYTVGL